MQSPFQHLERNTSGRTRRSDAPSSRVDVDARAPLDIPLARHSDAESLTFLRPRVPGRRAFTRPRNVRPRAIVCDRHVIYAPRERTPSGILRSDGRYVNSDFFTVKNWVPVNLSRKAAARGDERNIPILKRDRVISLRNIYCRNNCIPCEIQRICI